MISMARKNLEIIEKFNKPTNEESPPSLFVLDAKLQLISSLSALDRSSDIDDDKVDKLISEMEKTCALNSILEGCHVLYSAYTTKSLILINKKKIKEALSLLEKTFEE